GRGGEAEVAEGFREDAADTEHPARPERGVADEAGDELAPPADHLGHEQRHLSVVRPPECQQLAGGTADGVGAGDAEPHEVPLRLVRDARAAELHDDREADRFGGTHCVVGIEGDTFGGDRDAVVAEDRLRFVLRERRHACVRHSGNPGASKRAAFPASGRAAYGARMSDPTSPAYARYVLGLLFLVYVFNFIDRQILAILLDPIK